MVRLLSATYSFPVEHIEKGEQSLHASSSVSAHCVVQVSASQSSKTEQGITVLNSMTRDNMKAIGFTAVKIYNNQAISMPHRRKWMAGLQFLFLNPHRIQNGQHGNAYNPTSTVLTTCAMPAIKVIRLVSARLHPSFLPIASIPVI